MKNKNGRHTLHYAWQADSESYRYPLMIKINGKTRRIQPKKEWQSLQCPEKIKSLKVRKDAFYVKSKKVK
jgi:hypothetical protein